MDVTTATGRRSIRADPWSMALLVGHAIIWLAVLAFHPPDAISDDIARFVQVAAAGGTPYRDVPVEYMPLETLVIKLSLDAPLAQVAVRVALISVVGDLVAFLLIRDEYGEVAGRWYLALALPLQVFMLFRLDMVAVVLVLLAFRMHAKGRPAAAGSILAAAILFKLWPIVLIPVLLRRDRRAVVITAVLASVGLVAWIAFAGLDGVRQVTSFRGSTGWHIESTPGVLSWVAGNEEPRFELGTMRIGSMTTAAVWALRVAAIGVLIGIWAKAWRRPGTLPEGMPSAAAVAALVAFAPVASAQYLAWILPWSAIAAAERRRRVATGAMLIAGVLAAASFIIYWEVAGGLGELRVLSTLRAACVLVVPVAWLIERREVAA